MDDDRIAALHARYWREGYGTVSVPELLHFRDLIATHRPASFLEVGTASGLSGGIIANLLEAYGGERFLTVDYDNTFFGDPTKENGFLLPELYPAGPVRAERRAFTTSLDVALGDETFEMAFVDANHQHPWPLIDTLCVNVVLRGSRIVIHDDLNLYRHQRAGRGIGPKVLYDQVPPAYRERYAANHGNVFSMRLDLSGAELERLAKDAFAVPWTLTKRLDDDTVARFRAVLEAHYPPGLLAFFDRMRERYNHPTGRLYDRT